MTDDWPFLGPLGGLDRDAWDALAGDRLYSSSRWLELCGADPRNPAGAVHLRTADGRRIGVPVAAVTAEPNPFYRWQEELAVRGLPAPPATGVLIGPHRGYQTHLLPTGTALPDSAVAAMVARLTALPRQAADAGLLGAEPPADPPCMAMFLTTADVLRLHQAGVRTTPLLLKADAWIRVPQGGWPAWLESLPARRRELVRREVRQFDRAGYRIVDTTLAACSETAARLLSLTEARYGHTTTPQQHAVSLGRQAAAMGESARVLLCLRGDEPVGYCCYYLCGDVLYLRSAGFDHARAQGAAEYFNLVYYLPLRIAGQAGATWVHAGIEATEAKALRGAELRPLWLLDLSENSVLRGRDSEIRQCNAHSYAELAGRSSAIAKALRQPEDETPTWGWGCRTSAAAS
ncbi:MULTISPECIES: GNAT family N-acetyltransferase [unclassified Streptomyces]|uniref:GNAT family N-acetyltransferase n=1 Tax=unclassified Streptomyces TaxID=2593676 RepID=UPI00344DE292